VNQPGESTSLARILLLSACAVVILAGIRVAAPVIGPVILALLITIAWSPGSRWLQHRGWPPALAALTGIVLGVVLIALFVVLVWSSLVQLQSRLPSYQPRVFELRGSIADLLVRLPFDSSRLLSAEALQPGAIVSYTLRLIGGITSAAGNLGILVLIMAFMMIESLRYPAKLHYAFSDWLLTPERLDAFVYSMRSYVVINAVFGLVAAVLNTIVLLALGVDFAILWGVLSFVLSFLPNVGFVLALFPPSLLALLQFGFARALMVALAYIVMNFVVDNVVKPRFVGESLDLSPAVVVLSLVFWGWLLGPVGALLAVPLSIALRFGCEAFPELRWLARLMSGKESVSAGVDPDTT